MAPAAAATQANAAGNTHDGVSDLSEQDPCGDDQDGIGGLYAGAVYGLMYALGQFLVEV